MKNKLINIVRYTFLGLCMVIVLFPLFFVFVSSFKSNQEIFTSAWTLPSEFRFDSYISVFSKYNMHTYFFNSLIYAFIVCILSIFVVTTAAYGIGRMKWKLSGLTMAFLLSGLMIPMHSILVPLYISVSRFHLPNQMALLIIFIAGTIPTSVFIVIAFLKGIPQTVEESAVIDGCGIPRLFITIVCPMIKPAIATVTIFNFLGVWNDLLLSLIFLNEESSKTVQLGILRFQGAFFSDYGLLLSGIVVALIPSILVYLAMSEKLINGVTAGAVKG